MYVTIEIYAPYKLLKNYFVILKKPALRRPKYIFLLDMPTTNDLNQLNIF